MFIFESMIDYSEKSDLNFYPKTEENEALTAANDSAYADNADKWDEQKIINEGLKNAGEEND